MRGSTTVRTLLPLLLVGMCLLAWFEPWIPPLKPLGERFGADFVLRVCSGLLCLFVLLLWGESLRVNAMLHSVLTTLKDFANASRGGDGAEHKRLEAVRLLVSAMASADPKVRESCREHLTRLCGQDLGEDPAAWQRWLAQREATPPGGR